MDEEVKEKKPKETSSIEELNSLEEKKSNVKEQPSKKKSNKKGFSKIFIKKVISNNNSNKKTSNSSKGTNNSNRGIMNIAYVFVGLIMIMLFYYSYFMLVESKEVINNAYNKRQDVLSEQVVRGEIVSAEGKALAYTRVDKEGKEKRIYPYGSMFSHIVGRVDRGRAGLESSENFRLLTSSENGIKKIYTEVSGEKNNGDRVVTTLNAKLQEIAYQALGKRKGAIVIMEPSSGKILAMVSKPDYDPNSIGEDWNSLVDENSSDSALLNRAAQGLYPPGSIFKILTTLEFIRENKNYETYSYTCKGHDIFNGVSIKCYNNRAHGEENLIESFAKSCNTSYANIGTKLNVESFRKLCDSFLFNNALPINLVHNKSSFVLNKNSDSGEIPQTVIGQGKTQITPLHAALLVSTIANGGAMMKPYVVDRIENVNGTVIQKNMPELYQKIITAEEAEILTTYMSEVVKNGTATAINKKGYDAAGKTGSAEYEEGKPAHAWFVGFAPARNPQIAVSIIVEGVGTGSEYAVPIADKIFDAFFN